MSIMSDVYNIILFLFKVSLILYRPIINFVGINFYKLVLFLGFVTIYGPVIFFVQIHFCKHNFFNFAGKSTRRYSQLSLIHLVHKIFLIYLIDTNIFIKNNTHKKLDRTKLFYFLLNFFFSKSSSFNFFGLSVKNN